MEPESLHEANGNFQKYPFLRITENLPPIIYPEITSKTPVFVSNLSINRHSNKCHFSGTLYGLELLIIKLGFYNFKKVTILEIHCQERRN